MASSQPLPLDGFSQLRLVIRRKNLPNQQIQQVFKRYLAPRRRRDAGVKKESFGGVLE
jgi:hypothetical protein